MRMGTRHVIPLATEPDTTNYELIEDPRGLFIPELAYDGAEIARRLTAWRMAQLRVEDHRKTDRAREFYDGRK